MKFSGVLVGFFFLLIQNCLCSNIAVFYALDEDIASLKVSGGEIVRVFNVGEVSIQQLSLDGHNIFAAKMGSGCVNTALTAQALLSRQSCDLVISIGPLGSLDSNSKIGDWYIASKVVAWQKGNHDGEMFSRSEKSELLISSPVIIKELPKSISSLPNIAVASGEAFVSSASFRSTLRSSTKCRAVGMNLFGLITVLNSHKMEGIHLRVISDNADGQASENFREFTKGYDGRGGKLVHEIVKNLPVDKSNPSAHKDLTNLLRIPNSMEKKEASK